MKEHQIDYEKVITVVEKTVSSSSLYWQSLSLTACFVLAYFVYKIGRGFIITRFPKNSQGELSRIVSRYVIPMLYAVLAVIFLSLGILVYGQFFEETIIFETALKLMALLLFLRFLRISSGSTLTANIAGFFLMPALLLDIFGALESTTDFLDEFALKIGNVRISIYLVIKAVIALLIAFWLLGLISRKSKSYVDSSKSIKSSTKNIISKFIDILVYAVVIIVLLKVFGVDMTTIAVLGGAIGVGIGFGLQKIASNFVSGIILLFEKAIEIGDIVELDNGNIYGTIKHFSGRYTLIEAQDGKEIMVPNEDFIIHKVTNWTHSNSRARVEINLGVAYGSDLELVQKIMIASAISNPRCLRNPDVECYVTNFGESDIKFTLYFWIADIVEGRMLPKSQVITNIWKEFKKQGIELSLPKREVRVVGERFVEGG